MSTSYFLRRAAVLLLAATLPAAVPAAEPPAAAPEAADVEQAREQLRRAQEEMARAAKELGRVMREKHIVSPRAYAYEFVTDPDRAVLGVTIANGPERKGQLRGVLVTGVTPGSGADKAGLKSGDLLLSANGSSLAGVKDGEAPVERLREIMNGLEPGDAVKLDYEREGRHAQAVVTASRPQHPMMPLPMLGWHDDDDFDVLIPPLPPPAPLPPGSSWAWRDDVIGAGLQLARLDDDLATYFKTRDGVLVVHAPQGGSLALKSGDVVRRINGRSVSSPVAAWQELAEAGDAPIRMDIIRHGKDITLEGSLPEPGENRAERRAKVNRKTDE